MPNNSLNQNFSFFFFWDKLYLSIWHIFKGRPKNILWCPSGDSSHISNCRFRPCAQYRNKNKY